MNRIRDADFMEQFPPALKKDIPMEALGRLVAEELHITAEEIRKNIIYADIEKLSEKWLDVLAYDLHVDWYDYDYPVDIKRAVIRNGIRIHQKLGTKYAVETAMRDVHKGADVSEWFEYGGKPYHFKIDVDISREGLSENTGSEITDKVNFYKNLRSHCDGIYYHLSANPANVLVAAGQSAGATLKVKAKLPGSIKAEGKLRPLAEPRIGAALKVKAKLAESVKGPTAGITMPSGVMSVDRMKIKAEPEKELKAGFKMKGFGYQRMENRMMVRKGK